MIGTTHLEQQENVLFMDVLVFPKFQRAGLGTSIVKDIQDDIFELGYKSIEISIDEENIGYLRLFEKAGFAFVSKEAELLAKALDYVSLVGMDKIAAYEHELTQYAMQRLKEIPGMRIFGEAEDKGSVISFLVGDIHHFDMGTLLDRLGIAVRTGHHCAQPLMQRLGIEGTVRASFGLYNTREEIDVLVAGIVRVSRMF